MVTHHCILDWLCVCVCVCVCVCSQCVSNKHKLDDYVAGHCSVVSFKHSIDVIQHFRLHNILSTIVYTLTIVLIDWWWRPDDLHCLVPILFKLVYVNVHHLYIILSNRNNYLGQFHLVDQLGQRRRVCTSYLF